MKKSRSADDQRGQSSEARDEERLRERERERGRKTRDWVDEGTTNELKEGQKSRTKLKEHFQGQRCKQRYIQTSSFVVERLAIVVDLEISM
jgi:hypothetical protein